MRPLLVTALMILNISSAMAQTPHAMPAMSPESKACLDKELQPGKGVPPTAEKVAEAMKTCKVHLGAAAAHSSAPPPGAKQLPPGSTKAH